MSQQLPSSFWNALREELVPAGASKGAQPLDGSGLASTSDFGRAYDAWYKNQGTMTKIFNVVGMQASYHADVLRIITQPGFWDKSGVRLLKIDVASPIPGTNAKVTIHPLIHPGDIAKAARFAIPKIRVALEKNPMVGKKIEEAQNQSGFNGRILSLFQNLVFDPLTYGLGPVAEGLKVGVSFAGKVLAPAVGKGLDAVLASGRKVEGALGSKALDVAVKYPAWRKPAIGFATGLANRTENAMLVSSRFAVRPISRLGGNLSDDELLNSIYEFRGMQRLLGDKADAAVAEARAALKPYSRAERREAGRLWQEAENLADYSLRVKNKEIAPAASNRSLELFGKLRNLAQREYMKIPVKDRQFVPGVETTWEEFNAQSARLEAVTDANGHVMYHRDPETGKHLVRYRQSYARLPRLPSSEVVETGPAKGFEKPSALQPRHSSKVVDMTHKELETQVAQMIDSTERFRLLQNSKDIIARSLARSAKLGKIGFSPREVNNSLDFFLQLQKEIGPQKVNRVLKLLDDVLVNAPKRLVTQFNIPGFYVKNMVDTQGTKNLLAGVPLSKLSSAWYKLPTNLFGKEMNFGGSWGKEMAVGSPQGKLLSQAFKDPLGELAKGANWTENAGRNALGEDVYWKTVEELGGHSRAYFESPAGRNIGRSILESLHQRAMAVTHRAVRNWHFDYDDLSTADKIMKRLYPFWVFQSNEVRLYGQLAATRPRLALAAVRGQESIKGLHLPIGPPTLVFDGFSLVSWNRFTQFANNPELRKTTGKTMPALEKFLQGGQKIGVYPHPGVDVLGPLVNSLAGKDLLDDKSWKNYWPTLNAIGKMFGKNLSYEGIRILVAPGERESRMESGVNKLFNRRVFERRAYSLLEGKPLTLQQSEKYVLRESMVAGALALMGVYVKVREPEAQRMIKMLDDYDGKSFARQLEIRRSNKALDAYLYGQGR